MVQIHQLSIENLLLWCKPYVWQPVSNEHWYKDSLNSSVCPLPHQLFMQFSVFCGTYCKRANGLGFLYAIFSGVKCGQVQNSTLRIPTCCTITIALLRNKYILVQSWNVQSCVCEKTYEATTTLEEQHLTACTVPLKIIPNVTRWCRLKITVNMLTVWFAIEWERW
jgi:hypothetical protein